MNKSEQKIAKKVRGGEVAIIPTDTIYGIIASIRKPEAVEKVYKLKKRDEDKPCIILSPNTKEVVRNIPESVRKKYGDFLKSVWPAAVSIVLPANDKVGSYLHRGKKTLAWRVPDNKVLLEFLKISGPVIAPSANIQGEPPAQTTKEAQEWFGDEIPHYISKGKVTGQPSTVVEIKDNNLHLKRDGVVSWQTVTKAWQKTTKN